MSAENKSGAWLQALLHEQESGGSSGGGSGGGSAENIAETKSTGPRRQSHENEPER
jgi:hypothetical protein